MNKRLLPMVDDPDCSATDTLSTSGQVKTPSTSELGKTILLIDDDPGVGRAMQIAFRMAGHDLEIAPEPLQAFSLLARQRYDAIVLDLNYTPGKVDGREGLKCLARILSDDPAACVIVLTAHGGIRTAVTAMQCGATEFVVKPWNNKDLLAKVSRAIDRKASEPVHRPFATADSPRGAASILGEDARIVRLRQMIARIGPTAAGVTVSGRPGTGRTLAALALHSVSADAAREPLKLDMRDDASWEQLGGALGTVILKHPDRLGDISQTRLLERLVGEIRPIAIVGDSHAVVPALRRRIGMAELEVPALDERRGDIPMLARHFLEAAAERFGRPRPRLTEAASGAVAQAAWPDEVRGLALAMERAVLLSESGRIDTAVLALPAIGSPTQNVETGSRPGEFDLEQLEFKMIEAALKEHHHNISHSASALGLSRGALYRRMARYGL